jgi:hypothetical protein
MNNAGVAIFSILYVGIIVMLIAAQWRIFTKAGEAGWKVLIPIWNLIVWIRIVGRPSWWPWLLFLFLIPPVGLLVWFVIGIILVIDLATSFGRGGGFAVGIIFLPWIFLPILGFGDSTYRGPAAASS